jgi:Fic family protein
MYTPHFTISSKILSLVGQIDAAREVITTAPLVPAWERRFQTEARVRIVHHGTHLEGNGLNLTEVEHILDQESTPTSSDLSDRSELQSPILAKERDIQEVINYRTVMDYLDTFKAGAPETVTDESVAHPRLTESILKEIHRLTVTNLLPADQAGTYRSVKVVIKNTATDEITFRPPNPVEIPFLMSEFFTWLGGSHELHPLIRAGITHYELVRIHPFTDGNGRATRAFSLLLLFLEGYQVKKFFSLEEYYDQDPQAYYDALKSVTETGDLTGWLEYFMLGIAIEFNRVKGLVQKLSLDLHLKSTMGGNQIALTDRQIKLVEYLEKYHELGMGEARDLLPDVSDDTILRDLRYLVDKGLLTRRGNTKGAKYSIKN